LVLKIGEKRWIFEPERSQILFESQEFQNEASKNPAGAEQKINL